MRKNITVTQKPVIDGADVTQLQVKLQNDNGHSYMDVYWNLLDINGNTVFGRMFPLTGENYNRDVEAIFTTIVNNNPWIILSV